MFSNDLKNEMKKKFNLSDSIINSSKHYKIPKFVFKSKIVKPHNRDFDQIFKNKIISLRNFLNHKSIELQNISKTQYCERKRENMNKLLFNLQKEKIDLLINRAYYKYNDNIREYNTNVIIPRREHKIQLGFLPAVQRNIIIDHVMNKTQKYLPLINKKYDFMKYGYKQKKQRELDEEKKNKQMMWSYNFLQQKKLEDYEKIYVIKYLNTEQLIKNDKYKDEYIQKDFDSPKRNKRIIAIANNRNRNLKNNPIFNCSQTSISENRSIEDKNDSKNN